MDTGPKSKLFNAEFQPQTRDMNTDNIRDCRRVWEKSDWKITISGRGIILVRVIPSVTTIRSIFLIFFFFS